MYFYLFFRVFSQFFRRTAFLSQEALARSDVDGIEEDHPKNPASFVVNLGEGYVRIMQESLEYVALGSVAYVTIYFFYLSSDFIQWGSGALHAPLAVVAVCFLAKCIFLCCLKRLASISMNSESVNLRKLEQQELFHSVIDNFVVLAVFIVLVYTLIPDYALSTSDYVSEGGQIAAFVVSLLFVFINKLFQSYFIYPRHSPGEVMERSAQQSLSLTLMNASNLSGLQTTVSMIIYPVFLTIVYLFFESQGVCYFLLALFVSYMSVKGIELVSPIASATEILIQSSRLNAEMGFYRVNKKIGYSAKLLGELYTGTSYYMIYTMVFLIILFTENDSMDEVSLTSYKIIFCFMIMALFVVVGKALTGLFQIIQANDFTKAIQVSLVQQKFIQDPARDPPITELTKKLGSKAIKYSLFLYVITKLKKMGSECEGLGKTDLHFGLVFRLGRHFLYF